MEKISPFPIRNPFLSLMKPSKTPITVSTETMRFCTKPSLATADSCPWSYIGVSWKPSGIHFFLFDVHKGRFSFLPDAKYFSEVSDSST